MMPRVKNWRRELAAFIEERRFTTFRWGVHDCCLFACDAVLRITGRDLAQNFRGKYSTRIGASRALLKAGARGVLALALDFEARGLIISVPVIAADQGALLVFSRNPEGPTLGVSVGEVGAFAAETGLVFIPRMKCAMAFTY